ncbi:hypothetical protein KL86DES1_10552 [uncultured Desulfovibrio sp.]|uniref:Uncharacterized protein n=1 Tax=uncultured Desulfovibrio sp. TaxID=167968 RepID=A0A212KZH4_9BACT|nr:hypothetical protein KL86DES1_10552 [uncultured Desulfovibrio sp.]VZH32427.1 conserved protein of unknown function [Desulfovibrio sp. 86]
MPQKNIILYQYVVCLICPWEFFSDLRCENFDALERKTCVKWADFDCCHDSPSSAQSRDMAAAARYHGSGRCGRMTRPGVRCGPVRPWWCADRTAGSRVFR